MSIEKTLFEIIPLTAKVSIEIFYPFEVVSSCRDP